jgi:ADP-ribosyl-[dinitrogen reductase] hydrolase
MTRADRVRGALWGLLVGDALGVPYEFHAAGDLPSIDQIEMEPPADFHRAHAGTPPGTWSDDGAHALCLLASLLHAGRLDCDDLMRRLVNWYEHGYLAVDGRVFDVGIQTRRAIARFQTGSPALACGPSQERDNGNGSLMRVLPLALWHLGSDAELIDDARKQSRITHGHARSQLSCALYCLWVRYTLHDHSDAWDAARASLGPSELDVHLEGAATGSGYVVDCLRSARWAVQQGSYERAVKAAISLGNDTDTTACVTGGLAGARDGLSAIPARWLGALRERVLVEPLLERLI